MIRANAMVIFLLCLDSGLANLTGDSLEDPNLPAVNERLDGVSSTVAYHLIVENFSNRTLAAYQHKASGVTIMKQKTILPRYAEALMGSKTGWTATGCTGTAAWKIGDSGEMLVVMWSVPFDQNWYSNWCAVGILPVEEDTSRLWEKMYYEPEVGFKRMEFTNSTDPYTGVVYKEHPDYAVTGFMDSSHKAYMVVRFESQARFQGE